MSIRRINCIRCLYSVNYADLILALFAIGVVILWAFHSYARDNGQWENTPAHIRMWFQTLMQPDNPTQSCCGEADAFEADTFEVEGDHYVAVITDGRGMLAVGTRIPVPNFKMKWDQGNPTGHGIIFLSGNVTPGDPPAHGYTYVLYNAGQARILYCYVTPTGI